MKLLFILALLGVLAGLLTNLVKVRLEKRPRPVLASSKIISDLSQRIDPKARAQAASTCAFLARNATMHDEMHASGIFNALGHVASSFDLRADKSLHSSAFTMSLLALSRMTSPHEGSEEEVARAVTLVQQHGLVPKALEALGSNVPPWVLASAQLMHSMVRMRPIGPAILQSLHQDRSKDGTTSEAAGLSKVATMFIGLSMGLVEGGAMGGSSDALVAGARLMSLVLEAPSEGQRRMGFKALEKKEAPKLLLKVISTHRGRNESSEIIGAAAEVLDLMILTSLTPTTIQQSSSSSTSTSSRLQGDQGLDSGDDSRGCPDGHDDSSTSDGHDDSSAISSSVLKLLGESGAVRDLIQELRPQPKLDSAAPVLGLLSRLSFTSAGSEQLISGGMLSMCSQIYFSRTDLTLRLLCMDMICDLARAPRYRVEGTEDDRGDQKRKEGAERRMILGILDSNQAHRHIIQALLGMIEIKGTSIPPGLHISSLQALVDVADQEHVARVISSVGGIEMAVDIINRDLAGEGLYPTEWAIPWAIQTKRAAVTLIAVISTHPSLRPAVVETRAIEAICRLMKDNLYDGTGIRQQIRVTAAAALYPILGSGVDELVVRRAAPALDALVPMLRQVS